MFTFRAQPGTVPKKCPPATRTPVPSGPTRRKPGGIGVTGVPFAVFGGRAAIHGAASSEGYAADGTVHGHGAARPC